MICKKCGCEIDDNSKICGWCGTKTGAGTDNTDTSYTGRDYTGSSFKSESGLKGDMSKKSGGSPTGEYTSTQPPKYRYTDDTASSRVYMPNIIPEYYSPHNPAYVHTNKKKLIFSITGGCVLLLAVIIGVFLIVNRVPGYERPIQTLIKLCNEKNTEKASQKVLTLFPMEYMENSQMISDEMYSEAVKQMSKSLAKQQKSWREDYGYDVRASYEILNAYELSEYELDDLRRKYSTNLLFGGDLIEKAMELDVMVIIKGSKDMDSEEASLTVIRIDGKWYLDIFSDIF